MTENTNKPEKTTDNFHRRCCTEPSTNQVMGIILSEGKGSSLLEYLNIIREIRKDFPHIDLSEVRVILHEIKGQSGYMGVKFKIGGEVPSTYLEVGRS